MSLISILLLAMLVSPLNEYDYYLSLEYYEAPVFHLERSVEISRKEDNITVKCFNYSGRDYTKPVESDDYIKLLDRLNRFGIWNVKSDGSDDRIRNNYYFLKIRSSERINLVRYEMNSGMHSSVSSMPAIIRTIENFASLYNPDNN